MGALDYIFQGALGGAQGYLNHNLRQQEMELLNKELVRRDELITQRQANRDAALHQNRMDELDVMHKNALELEELRQSGREDLYGLRQTGKGSSKEYDPKSDIDFLEKAYADYTDGLQQDEFSTQEPMDRMDWYYEKYPSRAQRAFGPKTAVSESEGNGSPMDKLMASVKPGANQGKQIPEMVSHTRNDTKDLPMMSANTESDVENKVKEATANIKSIKDPEKASKAVAMYDDEIKQLVNQIKGGEPTKFTSAIKDIMKYWEEFKASIQEEEEPKTGGGF